jgi:serine/threonine protein kinase
MSQPSKQVGPYKLTNKIGQGAFGEVWLAERRTEITTTLVAVKIPLDTEADTNLIKQEANLWVQASGHINVLPIIEANIYDGQIVIVSEYAPNGSLSQWLAQHGGAAPSVEKAIEMANGILGGLQHLHEKRIVHRDLKPPNILLQGETPRLSDFGISRVLTSSRSGVIAGTPQYMAPEAFDGERNEKTDIWSAGVILYQLLSGHLPFPQKDATSLLGAILNREPDPLPSSVPTALQAVIMKSISKDPAQRYSSTAEMRAALRAAGKAIDREIEDVPTIKDPERLVTTKRMVVWIAGQTSSEDDIEAHSSKPASKTLRKLLEFTKYFIDETKPTVSTKPVRAIRKWSLLKSWMGDYKSAPREWAFDGKTLASFYGPMAIYDGPQRFRIKWSDDEKEDKECRIYLWHIPTGAILGSLIIDDRAIGNYSGEEIDLPYRGAFSPNAKAFACSLQKRKRDGIVSIWNINTGSITDDLNIAPEDYLLSMTYSPSGRYLACSCTDQTIKVWDFNTNSISKSFPSHSGGMDSLTFSPDERVLAGVGFNQSGLRLWDWKRGELLFSSLVGKSYYDGRATFSPDGSMLAIVSSDHKIMIWDISRDELQNVLDSQDFDGSFISFSPDGLTLACRLFGKEKLGLGLIDVRTGEMKAVLDKDKQVCCSTFSSYGKMLVNWCTDKTITLWKAD